MSRAFKSKLSGLTLVELVVSIGILTLLLGISIPSFRNGSRSRQLDLTAEEVRDAVILARTNILSPDRSRSSDSLAKMSFKITAKNTYQITDGLDQLVLNGALPADLEFLPPLPIPAIDFQFADQGSTQATQFSIQNTSTKKSRTINVLSSGAVEVVK